MSSLAAVGIVLTFVMLAAGVAYSLRQAGQAQEVALGAVTAQQHLQRYLRGVNEALLTEGSSASRELVKQAAGGVQAELQRLQDSQLPPAEQAVLNDKLLPGWQKMVAAVNRLMAHKSLSATEDDAMLAYGKLSGDAEPIVQAMSSLEATGRLAVADAQVRMFWAIGIAALLSVLLVPLLGRLVLRNINDRLGGTTEAVREVALQLAQHNLQVHIELPARSSGGTLMEALLQIRDNLGHVVGQVRQSAQRLEHASAEIAAGNMDLSARTENQASARQQTSVTMESLAVMARANVQAAQTADEQAMGASQVAVNGGKVVSEVVATMQEINESSRRISEIIGVIDGIAFQTNILALNAAVEAARAGDQGRGFAVVANEVRTLAQRSGDAAREIRGLIQTSVARVGAGTEQVARAGVTMNEVVSSIQRVTALMADIRSASGEQDSGVREVGSAVSHMDQATQQNAALVEQSAAAASNLRQEAQNLVQAVAVFKLPA